MFSAVSTNVRFPEQEEKVLEFWANRGIYAESLRRRELAPPFVFYEGPPTANGLPHPGHCLTRAIKDLFPRYKTMQGFRCERKAGWDTHGLPVEVEVGKELGIHRKEEIEAYGVEPFIQKCQQSVWRYMQQWERLTTRLGFWVDLDEAYVTYHQSYVESVWWSLKNLFDRGLLYQGHKIVWWWAQGGTALSAGEVGQGYREVADPSVYVKFPLVDAPDRALLVWTTTPWTLPSNMFAASIPTSNMPSSAKPVRGICCMSPPIWSRRSPRKASRRWKWSRLAAGRTCWANAIVLPSIFIMRGGEKRKANGSTEGAKRSIGASWLPIS
jgi:isoleucyl-tRNA synthetase